MFEQLTQYWLDTLNWQPNPEQAQTLEDLYKLVLAGNQVQNLTRITETADFWEKHLWDSLRGILPFWQQQNLKVIDIGTGAGFPGLPVAIAHPTWQLTLLDSRNKKIEFIRHAVSVTNLSNVRACGDRAEKLHKVSSHTHQYDLALVRAVGNGDLCAKYAVPFLKPNGQAILYRGQWTEAEQIDLEKTCQLLKVSIRHVENFVTPLSKSIRHCIYLGNSQLDS